MCATRAKRYLSVQVSINVSIPKGFQINCSIDLCYIKTAISETLPLYSIELYDIQGAAIHITNSTSNKVGDGGTTDMRLLNA